MKHAAKSPLELDLTLPTFTLEAGAPLASHRARALVWSTEEDQAGLASSGAPDRDRELPTVLVLPPLTHDARVAGPGGFWDAVTGDGRALRPWAHRIVSFALLGSCFGTSGPADPDFPNRMQDTRFPPCPPLTRGMPRHDERALPATVTTWDQAKSVLFALDALGIDHVELACGGSIGGMIALALAMLAPKRFGRIGAIAAPLAASAWMIGWNHAARAALLADPTFPVAREGLRIARQIARMTYRAPAGLADLQGRRIAGPAHEGSADAWSSRTPYRVETWLEHAADTFDLDARAYIALTSAMDHHDVLRAPDPALAADWSLARITADVHVVAIDSDALVPRAEVDELGNALAHAGVRTTRHVLTSTRGHDAFLSEQNELQRVLSRMVAGLAPRTT